MNEGTLTLRNAVVSGNSSTHRYGAGIYNAGTLALLENTRVSGNTTGREGAGIYNTGTLNVRDIAITDNSGRDGVGIWNSGAVDVVDSVISDNTSTGNGVGIWSSGTLNVSQCSISTNATTGTGGAVYNKTGGTATITNSTLSGNTAYQGAGVLNAGQLNLTGVLISDSTAAYGAGIAHIGGSLAVVNSTLSNNTAESGDAGAIYIGVVDSTTVTSSIFSANTAIRDGGAVAQTAPDNQLTVTDCAFTDNVTSTRHGGAIMVRSGVISDSTFSNNSAPYGGAVYQFRNGDLDVNGCTFTSNHAIGMHGGAIANDYFAPLTVSDSFIIDNEADFVGGGIFSYDAPVELTNVTLSGNSALKGGGLASYGTVSVVDSTISNNIATEDGGGAFSASQTPFCFSNTLISNNTAQRGGGMYGGAFALAGCTVSDNTASSDGGGVWVSAELSVINSTIADNDSGGSGGGIRTAGAVVEFANNTVANNTATTHGGGIHTLSSSVLAFKNSTISGNTAGQQGGGIYHWGYDTVDLTNLTITNNDAGSHGGGIYARNLNLANTVIAENTSPTGPDGCGTSAITSLGHNLIGDDSSFTFTAAPTDLVGTTASPIDPLLEALADNGGPTRTHALLPGSPAFDAGDNSLAAGITTDQRGLGFPRLIDGNGDGVATVDIGAFESELLNRAPVAEDDAYTTDEDTILIVSALTGDTWYVDDDAPGDLAPGDASVSDPAEDGTAAHPFDTIQEAIDAAANEDTVLVAQGTYRESLLLVDKAVVMQGAGAGLSIVNPSATDGGPGGRGLTMRNVPNTARVEGFTFTGGQGQNERWGNTFGGAILCDNSSPTIASNEIADNYSGYKGGGISVVGGTPTIADNVFHDNSGGRGAGISGDSSSAMIVGNVFTGNNASGSSTGYGGGIYWTSHAPLIANNVFTENYASLVGGAMNLGTGGTPTLVNNLVAGNSSGKYGGGIGCYGASSVTITNNTIVDNSATYGGGVFFENVNTVDIANSILRGNSANQGWINPYNAHPTITVSYSNVEGGSSAIRDDWNHGTVVWGDGNIDADPLFADTAEGNYRLSAGSTSINVGNNGATGISDTDLDANLRIADAVVDMGAYESNSTLAPPAPSPAVGVLSNDTDPDAGDALTVIGYDSASSLGAAISVNADGSFSYDPNGLFDYLALGETTTDTFSYTITDSFGATDSALVTVTVEGANDAPVVDAGADQAADEGTPVDFAGTFTDVDASNTHILTWDFGDGTTRAETAPIQWRVEDGGNDHWYQVVGASQAVSWSDANAAATAAGGYLATLTSSAENQLAFDLADHPEFWTAPISANRGPWLGGFQSPGASAPDAGWQWVTGETWDFTSWGIGEPNDFGGEQDRLHFLVGANEPYEAVWNDQSVSTYSPTSYLIEWDSIADIPTTHTYADNGTYTVTLTDNDGASTSDTLTVTVSNVAPLAVLDDVQTNEDTSLAFNALDNDTDAGAADILTAVAATFTTSQDALVTILADGTATYDPNGQFEYLGAGETATDTFIYQVEDDDGGSDQGTVTVTIVGANDAPVADADAYLTYGDSLTVTASGVLDGDTDAEGDSLSAVLIDAPDFDASFVLNPDGSFTYTPDGNFGGIDSFTYVANDGLVDRAPVVISIRHALYVTNTNDIGEGSFRWTIDNANGHMNDPSGPDTIRFAIDTGLQTIQPVSALPTISDPVFVDGASQPGFAGTPIVELDGSLTTNGDGLLITASNSTVCGLVVNRFSGSGIVVTGSGAVGNVLIGNYIGLNAAGTAALGNAMYGVGIWNGASSNRIGTNGDGIDDERERNVISGNVSTDPVRANIGISNANANVVAGNFIGTDATGNAAVVNGGRGIRIGDGSQFNRIGTDGSDDAFNANERNVISGHVAGSAVFIVSSDENIVAGNILGLDVTGTDSLGQQDQGVGMWSSAGNRIGTDADGVADEVERNIISGNTYGVVITDPTSIGNEVAGNFIGTDETGTVAVGNTLAGVGITNGAYGNTIGGSGVADRNLISGNSGPGLWITDYEIYLPADNNLIQGNFIGLNADGTAALANSADGILIDNVASTLVQGNIISGNAAHGAQITGTGASENVLIGNTIGLNADGTHALGNTLNGVLVENGASNNRIGTNGDGVNDTDERNVISGNVGSGITMSDVGTDNNVVAGNFIGTDVTGTAVIGNTRRGVQISGGASDNLIGTDGDGLADEAERNIISANGIAGIAIWASNNVVAGNYIGTDVTGTLAMGNAQHGIVVSNGASHNLIGTDGDGIADLAERNVISANSWDGVRIQGSGSDNNVVAGNFIGTDAAGTVVLGNAGNGVFLVDAPLNLIAGNIVSGNVASGVKITGSAASSNILIANTIGLDADGAAILGNSAYGVLIINGANNNLIGTDGDGVNDAAERNVISGNGSSGVRIEELNVDKPVTDNIVSGNFIGLDRSGTTAIGNGKQGVIITNAPSNTVRQNVISGNRQQGIAIWGSRGGDNVVIGNFVGTNAAGTAALPNLSKGVVIGGSSNGNRVESNLISGNAGEGVKISWSFDPGPRDTLVLANLIGTDISGTSALGNAGDGILIEDVGSTIIEGNVISENAGYGVKITGSGAADNVLTGNLIGLNAAGTAALGNGGNGVLIENGAHHNQIGTDGDGLNDAAERNLISGNTQHGVQISGSGTNNVVAGNFIGTDVTGTIGIGNAWAGINIAGGARQNLVGTNGDGTADQAERNILSANGWDGVKIEDPRHR